MIQTNESTDELLRWAARGQGWAFREWPPQIKRLAGGCDLIVIVPVHWRGRLRMPANTRADCITFPRRKAG